MYVGLSYECDIVIYVRSHHTHHLMSERGSTRDTIKANTSTSCVCHPKVEASLFVNFRKNVSFLVKSQSSSGYSNSTSSLMSRHITPMRSIIINARDRVLITNIISTALFEVSQTLEIAE